MMDHWQPLLDLIELVDSKPLKKAMRQWVNKNQNCAYSIKMGHCDMQCLKDDNTACPNDVTLGILVKESKNENNLPGMQKPRRKHD